MAALPSAASSRAAPRFAGLWLFSRRTDLALLVLPFSLAALGALTARALGASLGDAPNRWAIWTAQNVLGNATHVALTFLLLLVRRDVLRADPRQGRWIALGGVGMAALGAGLFGLYYQSKELYLWVVSVLFNVFGLHHILSQSRGVWALHGLRASAAGAPRPTPGELRLQRALTPVCLTLVLTRLFFVPADGSDPTPYLDLGQGAPLPFAALLGLLGIWLAYFAAVLRTALRSAAPSGPKVLYLFALAMAVGITLLWPPWGNVLLPGMHGLEYYALSRQMLRPRGEAEAARFAGVGAMALCMAPLFALGLAHFFLSEASAASLGGALTPASGTAHPLYRAVISASLALVLWHYFTDAWIYRMRLPEVRRVLLARLLPVTPTSPPRRSA